MDHRSQTTLLTGASAGIGAEFARRLAELGTDLVLVARRQERLASLASELEVTHGIRVWPITMDLGVPHVGDALVEALSERDIDVTSVINNAGIGTLGAFHEQDATQIQRDITLNVAALTDISRAFIDRLRSNGTGYLINIASVAAYQPMPKMAVYAASKAYVLSFTEALWQESLGSGLRVLSVAPGATETEFTKNAGPGAFGKARLQPPSGVVTAALRELERTKSRPSVVVGRANKALTAAGRLVSRRNMVTQAAKIAS